jgi:hypothetical protein
MLYIAIGSIGNVGIEPANRATIQVWMDGQSDGENFFS